MTAKVIDFSSFKKATGQQSDPVVWACHCGCFTFELHDDGSFVCAECGTVQVGYPDNGTAPQRPAS